MQCSWDFLTVTATVADAVTGDVAGDPGIAWGMLWMTLDGGLALFLAGLELMSDSLKSAAGEGLKVFLSKMTANRFLGALSGASITAILNSSSVTTVLVVGFISAGLMTLQQAIGIIMGANIGSTFTAQIVAFNVTQYALLPVSLGFAMRFVSGDERVRDYGGLVMGLGMVFFGMGLMGESMNPLRSYQPFLDLMVRMENPLLGILVGALFTALIQSSAATTAIAITMASGGLITLEAGVALALGSNIGTCATAMLAALGKTRPAVRAAVAHVVFNVVGVLLWVWVLPPLCDWVRAISPVHADLEGVARMSAEVPRQIANAHTLFNVVNTVLFIGFTRQLAKLVEWLVPDRVEVAEPIVKPKFLDDELLATPSLALDRVRMEIGHLGELTNEMFDEFRQGAEASDEHHLQRIVRMDDKIDILSDKILRYLASMPREKMNQEGGEQLLHFMVASDTIESVGDIFESELVGIMRRARAHDVHASEAMRTLMVDLFDTVQVGFNLAIKSVIDLDEKAAQRVLSMKPTVNARIATALEHQAARLTLKQQNRLEIFRMEMEFVESVKRIYSLSKRIAKLQLPDEIVVPDA